MKLLLILTSLVFSSVYAHGQKEWSVYGKVINHENKKPISSINITNPRSRKTVATNEKGDFYIRAADGDSLLVTGIGYAKHGIRWSKGKRNITIEVNQTAISLEEVVITDKKSKTLEKEIRDFLLNKKNASSMKMDIKGDVVTLNPISDGGSGMGISIDALYELWSKEGKNRRKAAELEYQDLKKYYISLRYNEDKVGNLVKLQGEELKDFMSYCHMSDDFILRATEYDLIYHILKCRKTFRRSFFPSLEE